METRMWVIGVIMLLFPLLGQAENIAVHTNSKLTDGTLHVPGTTPDTRVVQGDWRFSAETLDTVSDESFAALPVRDPLVGSFFYLNFQDLPEKGTFIMRIQSDRDQDLAMMFGGLVASSSFHLHHDGQKTLLYQVPAYLETRDGSGRIQLPYPYFSLKVPAGTSFLSYEYQQKAQKKGQQWAVNAGLVGPLYVGTHDRLWQRFHFKELFLKIPLGIFFCLCLYSTLIYFSRGREDYESLILAVINGMTFLREFLTQTIILNFVPSNPWWITLHAFGFGMPILITGLSAHFLYSKLRTRFLYFIQAFCFLNFALLSLHSLVLLNSSLIPGDSPFAVLCILLNALVFFAAFIPYSLWAAFQMKNSEITFFAVGICCFGLGTSVDFINTSGNYGWPWVSMWGGMVFSILLAKNNSRMFAKTFESSVRLNRELQDKNREIEQLNHGLEKNVLERTSKIKALLEYIPQGVLSIGQGGLVDANYSSQLSRILDTHTIADQSFLELFIQRLALNPDERDQLWQAINAAIGEAAIGFDMNTDKLPLQVVYHSAASIKHMRLTWNTEIDEAGLVKRILVTIQDVTQEVNAQKELEEKNQDLAIIKQLAELSHKKALQFFASGKELLQENSDLISAGRLDEDALKILFVNMHTIKGAARTLQLKDLSNVLHQVEARYAAILRQQGELVYEHLATDIKHAQATFDRYQRINRDVLGRDQDFSKIHIDRDFLEEHCGVLHKLVDVPQLPASLKTIIHKNRDQLTQMIFLSLHNVLQEIMGQAEKIAQDLGKIAPEVHWNVQDCLISHRQETLLKNSFLHIIRNALDHGIETAEERRRSGKDAQGHFHVLARRDQDRIRIEFRDDGRGMALEALKERAQAQGILLEGASRQSIANTVFTQGVSTARQVTQISGRGVGMSAARRFFEAEHGDIQIELLDDGPATEYCPFKIVMLMEAQDYPLAEPAQAS